MVVAAIILAVLSILVYIGYIKFRTSGFLIVSVMTGIVAIFMFLSKH